MVSIGECWCRNEEGSRFLALKNEKLKQHKSTRHYISIALSALCEARWPMPQAKRWKNNTTKEQNLRNTMPLPPKTDFVPETLASLKSGFFFSLHKDYALYVWIFAYEIFVMRHICITLLRITLWWTKSHWKLTIHCSMSIEQNSP